MIRISARVCSPALVNYQVYQQMCQRGLREEKKTAVSSKPDSPVMGCKVSSHFQHPSHPTHTYTLMFMKRRHPAPHC